MQDYQCICSIREEEKKREERRQTMQNKRMGVSGDTNGLLSLSTLHLLVPNTLSIMNM